MVGACIENDGRGGMSLATLLSQVMILQLPPVVLLIERVLGVSWLFACSNLSLFRVVTNYYRLLLRDVSVICK